MSLSVLCAPHETSVMARKRHSRPASRAWAPCPLGRGPQPPHTPQPSIGSCRERHVHDTTTAANGTYGTLNDPNVPFTAHPVGNRPQPPREPNWPTAPFNVLK